MSDLELETAITQAMERRNLALEALEEERGEMDNEGPWTPGEAAEWAARLQLAGKAVDLEERRIKMLRSQR